MKVKRFSLLLYICLLLLLPGCFSKSQHNSKDSVEGLPTIAGSVESTENNERVVEEVDLYRRKARTHYDEFSKWREIHPPQGSSWSIYDDVFIGEFNETIILNIKTGDIYQWNDSDMQTMVNLHVSLPDGCSALALSDRVGAYDLLMSCMEGEHQTITILSLDPSLKEVPCPVFQALKTSLEESGMADQLTSCVIVDEHRALISMETSGWQDIYIYDQREATLLPLLTRQSLIDLIAEDLEYFQVFIHFQRAADKIMYLVQPTQSGDYRYYLLRSDLEGRSLELIHQELGFASEINWTAADTVCWFRFSALTRQNENELYCIDDGGDIISFPYVERNDGAVSEVNVSSLGEHLIRSYPESGEIQIYELRDPANRIIVDMPEELTGHIATLPRYRLIAHYDDIDKLLYLKFVYLDQDGEIYCKFFVKQVVTE